MNFTFNSAPLHFVLIVCLISINNVAWTQEDSNKTIPDTSVQFIQFEEDFVNRNEFKMRLRKLGQTHEGLIIQGGSTPDGLSTLRVLITKNGTITSASLTITINPDTLSQKTNSVIYRLAFIATMWKNPSSNPLVWTQQASERLIKRPLERVVTKDGNIKVLAYWSEYRKGLMTFTVVAQ